MDLARAFREEVERKVGHVHELVADRGEPTLSDFVELFPATTAGRQAAAKAAGYGGPGEHRQGSRAWTRRRSFMRELQRYTTTAGQRRRQGPGGRERPLNRREASIVRSQWRKQSRPGNVRAVLRAMNRYGATVTNFTGKFRYEPQRRRQLDRFAVGVRPAVARRSGFTSDAIERLDWRELSEAFLLAFGRAYGMGDYGAGGASSVEAFTFRLGYAPQAAYHFGSKSRPPGAKRASGNKYRGIA